MSSIIKFFSIFLLVFSLSFQALADPEKPDFNGDGLGDLVLYDSSNSTFSIRHSGINTFQHVKSGYSGSLPITGDFDGDGKTDYATYKRDIAEFYVKLSSGENKKIKVGEVGSLPLTSRLFLGCDSLIAFNPKTANWSILACDMNHEFNLNFGPKNSLPFVSELDGDGRFDIVFYEKQYNAWTVVKSTMGASERFFFGLPGDVPLIADYNGDGKYGIGVYRPSSNYFYFNTTYVNGETGAHGAPFQWGLLGDLPGVFNVGADARTDVAIFRPGDLKFYVYESATGLDSFTMPYAPVNPESPLSFANYAKPFHGVAPYPKGVSGDYNGDRRADFVTVNVDRTAGKTTFDFNYSDLATESRVINFDADAIVPGDFNGDGKTQPAIVKVNPQTSQLEWYILNYNNTLTKVAHGVNGGSPIVGDLNCDGVDDKIVLYKENGYYRWDMLLSDKRRLSHYYFGFSSDTPYVADVDGDYCDEIIVARKDPGTGLLHWYYRGIEELVDHYVQWGFDTDTVVAPTDMNGDGKDDFYVVREGGGFQQVYVRFNQNYSITYPFGLSGDVPMAGFYSGVNYGESAVLKRASNDTADNVLEIKSFNGTNTQRALGKKDSLVIKPDGTVDGVIPPGSNSGGNTGGGTPPPASPGCTPTPGTDGDFVDGGGNALWKPVSEGTPNRAAVILLPSSPYCGVVNSTTVTVLDRNGQILSGVQRKHCNGVNDNRPHFYLSKTASEMAPHAPLTVKIQYSGITECRSVPDPNRRYD